MRLAENVREVLSIKNQAKKSIISRNILILDSQQK